MKILKNTYFKILYWYISLVDKNAEVTFMNFGYSKNNQKIKLDEKDEKNRYFIQLYNLVASHTQIDEKDILEIGCGRGGGISYIHRYFCPKSATALDLSSKAIKFCKNYYSDENIEFVQGDAKSLPFLNMSFELVISVESTQRFQQMKFFLPEVYRVLKPGGFFLFAEFGPQSYIEKLNQQLKDSKFKIINNMIITERIIEALKLSSDRREQLISKIAPKFLKRLGKKFAATEGTLNYKRFISREFEYLFYVVTKVQ